jgi:hypothetical protein
MMELSFPEESVIKIFRLILLIVNRQDTFSSHFLRPIVTGIQALLNFLKFKIPTVELISLQLQLFSQRFV